MTEAATKTVEGPLTGRTLEVDTKTNKVVGAKDNVVKLPEKGKAKAKPEAKKPAAAKKGGKKITKVAKDCPARSGSKRAKFWAKIKNGMTPDEASEAGIPARFLKKMVKSGHIKIAA